ncbi:TetR family transcriptional regulator [Janibacter sp. G1551]|uniref:TetR family transcriptional regulator n=1 Tax=Janibacter sp. G1551 TaxID=3420440 RepID=UPI003D030DDD
MSLTREDVVDAALSLLRTFGLGDLSMRRLARELGVQPGALYWHVASKQALLVEVASRLLEPTRAPAAQGLTPEDALVEAATGVRRALLGVPDGSDVVALAWAVDPAAVPALTDLAALVEAVTGPGERHAAATHLVLHHVLGSVTADQTRERAAAIDPARPAPEAAAAEATFASGLALILRGIGVDAETVA